MGACCFKEDKGEYQTMAVDYPRAQYNSRSTSGNGPTTGPLYGSTDQTTTGNRG